MDENKSAEELRKEFESVTRPVIEWLNANYHPHVSVMLDPTSAKLVEDCMCYQTHDYLRD